MTTARLLFAAALLPFSLSAQTSTGEIDVTVLDQSGAIVPKAQISVSGAQTGNLARTLVSRLTITNDETTPLNRIVDGTLGGCHRVHRGA
jgi:hypothetical protein